MPDVLVLIDDGYQNLTLAIFLGLDHAPFAFQWLHTQGAGGTPRTEGAGGLRDYIEAFNSMEDSRAYVDSCAEKTARRWIDS
ncbi:hypothetical protein L226DRAFT_539717 [Lentinus tigrinus ALCF2SS1-7]|uniref:uncharacterized protein n=1 Tax=Lentinus tigrinus ALCF2SS1-7 TaxID=1328758 RepID=UPI00116634C9|nr:hypothetical protein L226DRAFT_539717 [Lentinus tigrinus ALCF2SS1-7]